MRPIPMILTANPVTLASGDVSNLTQIIYAKNTWQITDRLGKGFAMNNSAATVDGFEQSSLDLLEINENR